MSIRKHYGFTLIELLIVVAIIAILAAIAIPNFLEAQVRSKVSREKANMRSIATALEAYRVDGNRYPPDYTFLLWYVTPTPATFRALLLSVVTTPVAYMTSVPDAIFQQLSTKDTSYATHYYTYVSEHSKERMLTFIANWGLPVPPPTTQVWGLCSWGPDQTHNNGYFAVWGENLLNSIPAGAAGVGGKTGAGAIYDSSNGTISNGDIVRVGP